MAPERLNGELIDAQVEAIMSGNRRDIDRYLVRGVMVMQARLAEIPAKVNEAVVAHATACPLIEVVDRLEQEAERGRGRRSVWAAVPNWALVLVAFGSLVVALIALVVHG